MAQARKAGHVDLDGYKAKLKAAGFAVFGTDAQNMQVPLRDGLERAGAAPDAPLQQRPARFSSVVQIMLSACAASDGRWKLADVADFSSACGS